MRVRGTSRGRTGEVGKAEEARRSSSYSSSSSPPKDGNYWQTYCSQKNCWQKRVQHDGAKMLLLLPQPNLGVALVLGTLAGQVRPV